MSNSKDNSISSSIAIIGMAGRFPGAKSVSGLWDVLKNGRDTITHFSKDEILANDFDAEFVTSQENFVAARGVLEDVELFDADFFEYTPSEAAFTDPQQRIWLEIAYEALESSGYAKPDNDCVIGIYTGYLNSNYLLHNLLKNRADVENYVRTRYSDDFSFMLANTNSYIATRTAYKLNLNGPAINVQTACSTSLVSIILAVQSLLNLESDICIAGGINVAVPQTTGYFYQEGAIHSKDGHCRPFDADATGTVFGSGGGAVILKRMEEAIEDNDCILAVIRGAAMNNDGSNKVGFTAPSVNGQAECIALAQSIAEVDPETISYVEAHGTATPLGDPIEVAGLTRAFGDCGGKRQFCGIGSIKSNIGHLDSAAGIAALIKTVLALQHKVIPATLHYKKNNPNIRIGDTPFYVVDKLTDWKTNGYPRRAGVSSFGVGGTNAHIVLEEAPEVAPSGDSRKHQLLCFSARSKNSLDGAAENLAEAFKQNPALSVADAAWTLLCKRQRFQERRFVVCENNIESAVQALETLKPPTSASGTVNASAKTVAFGFPGQGSHYHGMAHELARHEPVFQAALAECCRLANRHIDTDLQDLFSADISEEEYKKRMSHNGIAQLAIFSVDYAIAQLWLSWGIKPSYLLGHSLGEWAAACISGVLSLEHAVEAVWHRGRLMHSVSGDGGALTVFADLETVKPYLGRNTHFAAENAPALTLISGSAKAIAALKKKLDSAEIKNRELDITVAVHSPALDDVIQPFEKILRKLDFKAPQVPIVSTATGRTLSEKETMDPAYWAVQMRKPVQFRSAIHALWQHENMITLLECGPGNALTSLCRLQGDEARQHVAVASLAGPKALNEHKQVLIAAGKLWSVGISIDSDKFFGGEKRRIVPVPAYSFDRKRYWIDAPPVSATEKNRLSVHAQPGYKQSASGSSAQPLSSIADSGNHIQSVLTKIWMDVLGIPSLEPTDDFRSVGGDSLAAVRLMERIRRETGIGLPLNALETAPTIEAMARVIEADSRASNSVDDSRHPRCLVPVKTAENSNRPLLFVPHGSGGDVHWGYVNITAGFDDDQGVWGFDSPKDVIFDSIEKMATYYIQEMKTMQPEGPYYLAGYCWAGVLAYEMARQLREANETVGFLGLVESSPSNTGFGKINVSQQYLQRFVANVPRVITEFLNRPKEEQKLRIVTRLKRLHRIGSSKIRSFYDSSENVDDAKKIVVEDFIGDITDVPDLNEETVHIWSNNLRILQEHTTRKSDLSIEVFSTMRQPINSPLEPDMGWQALTNGTVTCHIVPGSHGSIVVQPHAAQLGTLLCQRLKIAQERQSAK